MVEPLEAVCINTSCTAMPPTPKNVLISTLLSSFCLFSVILNLLVIISISHFRQLQTSTNLILLSLAVSDLLLGLVVMPGTLILLNNCQYRNRFSCTLTYFMSFILTSASIGNMVLMSVDRYVAICKPLRYSSMLTLNRVKFSLLLCWMLSVAYNMILLKRVFQIGFSNPCFESCVYVLDHISGSVDLILTLFGPIAAIIVLYMRVFVAAVSQARAMRSKISAAKSNSVIVKKSEIRAARTLGIIIVVFIICISPYFYPSFLGQNIKTGTGSIPTVWMLYLNSSINPLVYAFFYPWFRKAVRLIVSLQILRPGSREAKIL